ncbi:MAG: hypothetical protein FWG47_04135 [Propionibacteriaceae bacterium]|nr:hypothetical protein [Propionibacteriaceae bacterium]
MEQFMAVLNAAWQILLAGILFGAGLPALFAFGIRALAWGTGGEAEEHAVGEEKKPHLAGRLVAYAAFAFVMLGMLAGIGFIAAHGLGIAITFDGIMPVFTKK